MYESRSFEETVGLSGGFLLASTLHEFLINEEFEINAWELQLHNNLQDQLIQQVGNNYASEFSFGSLFEANQIQIWVLRNCNDYRLTLINSEWNARLNYYNTQVFFA